MVIILQHTILLPINLLIFKNREIRDGRKPIFASINRAKFNVLTSSEGKSYVAKRWEKLGVTGVGKGQLLLRIYLKKFTISLSCKRKYTVLCTHV